MEGRGREVEGMRREGNWREAERERKRERDRVRGEEERRKEEKRWKVARVKGGQSRNER